MKTKLSLLNTNRPVSRRRKSALLLIPTLALAILGSPARTDAVTFANYPAGDDLTSSMGQFQIILDARWSKIFDALVTNSPLNNVIVTARHGFRLYKNGGTLTSPTLYDFQTRIGRSDSFGYGSPVTYAGALAGQAPGRTYVKAGQVVLHPNWPAPPTGAKEVHTFLKSVNMTDAFTTHLGFSVKAGMAAPTRPVCAGQVEGGSAASDFPANSFFNVYVEVNIPGGGSLPPIQLVNVNPLLVLHTNIPYFPPHVVYYHGNTEAVAVYFNTNMIIHNPLNGQDIQVYRGDLFGQLTLAGHGAAFSSVEVAAFQVEFENESTNSAMVMPLQVAPITNVFIQDFAPDYNAAPRSLASGHFASGGSFMFTINNVTPDSTNYLQACNDLTSGGWQTIGTVITTTNNTFTFTDPDAINNPNRFYRLSLLP